MIIIDEGGVFEDKSFVPDEGMVADALGGSFPIWTCLRDFVTENYPDVKCEWRHYGKSSGWVLKLLSKKRNLLFFIPKADCFRLRFGISEKTAPCIEASDLSDVVKEAVRLATPYSEGISINVDFYYNEAKVMAYVKDRQFVDVGSIDGEQLELAKSLVQITK